MIEVGPRPTTEEAQVIKGTDIMYNGNVNQYPDEPGLIRKVFEIMFKNAGTTGHMVGEPPEAIPPDQYPSQ